MPKVPVKVDPLSVLLSHEIYILLTLPDPPPIDQLIASLASTLKGMTAANKAALLPRIQTLGAFTAAVEKSMSARAAKA